MTYSLSAQGNDFGSTAVTGEETVSNWASVEELASYDPFGDEEFEKEPEWLLDLLAEIEVAGTVTLDHTGIVNLDADNNPYRDFYPTYWDYDFHGEYPLPERDSFAVVRDGKYVCSVDCERFGDHRSEIELIEHELEAADNFMPSFSSNIEQRQPMTWNELELRARWNKYPWSSHNCGRKQAKFRVDGKLARKDLNYRWSRRHMQMQMFDQFYLDYTAETYLDDNARVNFH